MRVTLILLLLSACRALAFDWCVDSVNGSDSNSGTSTNAPFQTIGKLLSQGITSGQSIGLARGSHWRETLAMPTTNISVADYGAGALPILDCSDLITNTAWSKTAGLTNTYQATLTNQAASFVNFVKLWEDNVIVVRATDVTNCDMIPGTYWVSTDTTSPFTLYFHASDNSNPGSNGKAYEHNARLCGYQSRYLPGAGPFSLTGVETRRNLHNDGSLQIGKNSRVTNCIARDGTKHNCLVEQGGVMVGCQFVGWYGDINQGADLCVAYDGAAIGLPNTFINCSADPQWPNWQAGAFYGHGNGPPGTAIYIGCAITNCRSGFSGFGTNVFLTNCVAWDCDSVLNIDVSATLDGCYFRGRSNATDFGLLTLYGGWLEVYNTTFDYGHSRGRHESVIASSYTNCTAIVSDCTFKDWWNGINLYMGNNHLTATWNTWDDSASANQCYVVGQPLTDVASDYNVFGLVPWMNVTGTNATLAQWRAMGFDLHSSALSASLAGHQLTLSWPTNAGNFALKSSPVVGTGAVWNPADGTPSVVGQNYQVTVPATGSGGFFRLLQQ